VTAPVVADLGLIVSGIRDGSWVDATLGGFGASLDAFAVAADPIGTLAGWGVGWLIEHVRPLQEALDWLAGDAEEIAGHSAAWANVAGAVEEVRRELVESEVGAWSGAAGRAYRDHVGEHLAVLQVLGVAAGGVSSAVEGAGLVVALTRGIVSDLIAQFVATQAVRLPQWLAMEGLTVGLATPWVVGQVAGLVARWVNRIQGYVRGLLNSLRRLLPRTDSLRRALDRLFMDTGGHKRPDDERPREVGGTPFVDNIISSPRSLVGRSAQSIADQFNAAGYAATVVQTHKRGTSGNAIQVRIHGHPEITNIQVHPGGGRHTPEGSPYWKISTNNAGRIWVIPKDFRGAEGLRGNVVRYDE
jgi:hypothetical protein